MDESRIVQFDYIRVISLLGILLCHSLFESFEYSWLGRYFALTFNFLFLILSAFLLGSSWEKNGKPNYSFGFLTKRIVRLSKSYYPYLVILFLFLYISQDYISIRNIVSHVFYLPWFDKIEGYGHLWFMTMIALCYAGCLFISRVKLNGYKAKMLSVSVIIGGVLDFLVTKRGLPGYIFPYTIGYLLIFYNANKIMSLVKRIGLVINIVQLVTINSMSIFLFHNRIFDSNPFVSYLLGIACAISVFCFLFNIFSRFPFSKMIVWFSGISFEVYLVHEFFLGEFSVYKLDINPVLGFIALVALSIIAALPVHYLSKYNFGQCIAFRKHLG